VSVSLSERWPWCLQHRFGKMTASNDDMPDKYSGGKGIQNKEGKRWSKETDK